MSLRKCIISGLLLAVCAAPALAKDKNKDKDKALGGPPLNAQETAIIDHAIAREKVITTEVLKHVPVVETYIQEMQPDPLLLTVPKSDTYFLGRPTFNGTIGNEQYATKETGGFMRSSLSFLSGITKAFKLEYLSAGFTQMMLLDTNSFDRQHYQFSYVGRAFLGDVRTYVFDVLPIPYNAHGRFSGRIWIEDQNSNIVRLNGVYNGDQFEEKAFYHFDSWRTNDQPGIWFPAEIYIEETRAEDVEHTIAIKGQTRIWGYSLKNPIHDSADASIQVDNAEDESKGQDISPLQAERMWINQAETNILDRLQKAGLVAPPSPEIDGVLEAIVNNILVENKVNMQEDIHCRVLLTDPLESMAVGNTILLSRGLLDVSPDTSTLAMVLSFQLSHILLGHRIDTRFAFNDALLFPNEAVFQKIPLGHSQQDNVEAAKKAVELLKGSEFAGTLSGPGVFLRSLMERAPALVNLTTPRIGDGLIDKTVNAPYMASIMTAAPKLEMAKLDQVPALPLGSRVYLNSWTDGVRLMHTKAVAYYTARDKQPFEVLPVSIRLTRYVPPAVAPSAPAGPQPTTAGSTAIGASAPAAAPENNTPPTTPAESGQTDQGTTNTPQQQ